MTDTGLITIILSIDRIIEGPRDVILGVVMDAHMRLALATIHFVRIIHLERVPAGHRLTTEGILFTQRINNPIALKTKIKKSKT